MEDFSLRFSPVEVLALFGLMQCLYVLLYVLFRSGDFRSSLAPVFYFTAMACAFLMDAADSRWSGAVKGYEEWRWVAWYACLPLGTLLIFQVAETTHRLAWKYYLLLALIPIGVLPGLALDIPEFLYISGLVVGALSLLAVWLRRDLLDGLRADLRAGRERFWLILAQITLQAAFLALTLAFISTLISAAEWSLIRVLLGLAFVYIGTTSLLRIYPQSFRVRPLASADESAAALNTEEQKVLERLQALLERDKVYQEPSYGRAELARELAVGEAQLSRIVNVHYAKTIPQLLNELRVQDAQKLLQETDIPIQTVFEESGFNSITTFNRVFKELTGDSPTTYRARKQA